MTSSVFFRFKSQKEPTRVIFDGTGISVFELKREIITLSKLGDGTDFELILSSDDGGEVYDDDTTIIPRSTTVIAKRLPAAKPGRGGAARYVSGKMPVNARNSYRTEAIVQRGNGTKKTTNGVTNVAELQTEEERMAAVLKMGADQWAQQQQEMAHATPIHRNGPMKGKPVSVPDRPPPPGYVCFRCGEKGHWIQVCPTNDDPKFDGRPRIKRTTGIPRSFLKIVEKPTAITNNDGTVDDTKQPSGVMVNADGDWVIAEPDNASWEQFQAKAQKSAAAQKEEAKGSKELQDRGLECSIDKHLFVDPTKTPCCQTTYCNQCITNALLDDDLQCPNCGEEGVLIDDLIPDEETQAKIRSYQEEKAGVVAAPAAKDAESKDSTTGKSTAASVLKDTESKDSMTENASATSASKDAESKGSPKEEAKSPEIKKEESDSKNQASINETRIKSKSPDSIQSSVSTQKSSTSSSKKRPATTELENVRIPTGPKALVNSSKPQNTSQQPTTTNSSIFPPELAFMNQPAFTNGTNLLNMNNNVMGMPMTMPPMMGMPTAMMNPMMMPNGAFMNGMTGMGNQWPNMNTMFPQQPNNNFPNGMMPNTTFSQPNGQMPMGNNGFQGMNGGYAGRGMGNFANQQRSNFGNVRPNAEDSAYFRQPVNPHRHQGRRNVARPADYREI